MVLLNTQESTEMRDIEEGSTIYKQQEKDRLIFGVTQFVTEAHQSFHNLLTSYSQLQCDYQDHFQILHEQQTVDIVEEFFGAFAVLLQHFEHSKEVLYHSDEHSTEERHSITGKENTSRFGQSRNRRFSLPSVMEKDDLDIPQTTTNKPTTMNEVSTSNQTSKQSSTDSDSSHNSIGDKKKKQELALNAEVATRDAALRCSRSPLTVSKHLEKVKSKLDDEKVKSGTTTKRKITEHREPLYFQVVKETITEYEHQLNLEDDERADADDTKVQKAKPAEEQRTEFLNILQQKLQEKVPEKTETFEDMKLSRQKRMSITEPVYAEVIRKTLEQFGRRKLEHRKSLSEHIPCQSPNLLNMFEENLSQNNMIEEDSDDGREEDNSRAVSLKNEDPVYAVVLKHALKQRRRSLHPKQMVPAKIEEEKEEGEVIGLQKPPKNNKYNGHILSPIIAKKALGNNHSRSSSDISLASEEVSEINRKTFVSASPHRLHQHGDQLNSGYSKPALPVIPSPDYSVPDEAKSHPHHVSRPFWNNDEPPKSTPVQQPSPSAFATPKNEDSPTATCSNSNKARRSNSSKRKMSNSSLVNDVIKEEESPPVMKSHEPDVNKTTSQNPNSNILTLTFDLETTSCPEYVPHHSTEVTIPPPAPPQFDRSRKPSSKKKDTQSSDPPPQQTMVNKLPLSNSTCDTSTIRENTPTQISIPARDSTSPLISSSPSQSYIATSSSNNVSPVNGNNQKSIRHTTRGSTPPQIAVSPTQSHNTSPINNNNKKKEVVTVVPPPDYSPVSSPEASPNLSSGTNRKFLRSPSPLPVEKKLIEVLDDGETPGEIPTRRLSSTQEGKIDSSCEVNNSNAPALDRSKKPKKKMLSRSEMKAVVF